MFFTDYMRRPADDLGSGHFGAPRGKRTHNGIDFCADSGEEIKAPISGTVSKVGYPYGDDLAYRYVQITSVDGCNHRIFYINPAVKVGEYIHQDTIVGTVQNIAKRYKSRGFMHNHFHYEIKAKGGGFIDPDHYQ